MRRYRRVLPAPIAILTLVVFEPVSTGSEILESLATCVSIALCGLGESLRFWAWGSNVNRGPSGIRDRGPYAIMRHPLYLGNLLIVFGIATIFNNPWVYGLSLLPFAFLYFFIAQGDEIYMRSRFGANYEEYSDRVTRRFLPKLSQLSASLRSTRPLGWKLAVHKEFDSCCAWLAGLSGLGVYKAVLTYGWKDAWVESRVWLLILGISTSLVLVKTVHRKLSKGRVRIPALLPHSPQQS